MKTPACKLRSNHHDRQWCCWCGAGTTTGTALVTVLRKHGRQRHSPTVEHRSCPRCVRYTFGYGDAYHAVRYIAFNIKPPAPQQALSFTGSSDDVRRSSTTERG